MENVMNFYREVTVNEELRMKLSNLFKPYEGESLDERKRASLAEEVLLPFAKNAGFEFSMEELRQFEEDLGKSNENGELSIEELEAISGGLGGVLGFCWLAGVGAGLLVGLCFILGIV